MAKSKIELILEMKDRMTTSLKRAKEAVASNTEAYVNDAALSQMALAWVLRNSADGTMYEFRNGLLTDAVSGILAPPPMLSFKRNKNIVKTKIDGSDASVIESFGVGEWDITIDGILVDLENHQFPMQKLYELRELFEANATFEVMNSDIMGALGIEQMYFEKIMELKVLESYQDTVAFKFKANSIKPVEFYL